MKFSFGSALAAGALALVSACAHGNSDTKTATNETTPTSGTASPATAAGSGGDTAATGKSEASGRTGSADATKSGSTTGSMDNGSMKGTAKADDNGASGQMTGSTSGTTASGTATTTTGDSKSGTTGTMSGQTGDSTSSAQNGSTDKSGQASGTMGGMQGTTTEQKTDTATNDSSKTDSMGSTSKSETTTKSDTSVGGDAKTDGAMAGNDQGSMDANLRSVTGSVTKVDSQGQSITLDQQAGSSLTLTVDSSTKVLRNGRPLLGIQSLREGQKIRASFVPASNKAQRIEIVGGKHHRSHDKAMPADGTTGSMNGTNGSDGSIPGASDTGTKSKGDKAAGSYDNGTTPPPAADSLPADKDKGGTADPQKKDQ